MTSLASWAAVDSRDTASIYLVSDSRLSWPSRKSATWDYGRKLFASKKSADIFGYCGQALFPSLVLSQITDLIDRGAIFGQARSCNEKSNRIINIIETSFESYPQKEGVQILHCSREESGMQSEFCLYEVSWSQRRKWQRNEIEMPDSSEHLLTLGSGKEAVRNHVAKWENSDACETSRSVFAAFCDSLLCDDDPLSGGAPQLVGLYRKGPGRTFGIVYKSERYVHGLPINQEFDVDVYDWRNELFELCDPHTMKRKPDAQPQPRPFPRESS